MVVFVEEGWGACLWQGWSSSTSMKNKHGLLKLFMEPVYIWFYYLYAGIYIYVTFIYTVVFVKLSPVRSRQALRLSLQSTTQAAWWGGVTSRVWFVWSGHNSLKPPQDELPSWCCWLDEKCGVCVAVCRNWACFSWYSSLVFLLTWSLRWSQDVCWCVMRVCLFCRLTCQVIVVGCCCKVCSLCVPLSWDLLCFPWPTSLLWMKAKSVANKFVCRCIISVTYLSSCTG